METTVVTLLRDGRYHDLAKCLSDQLKCHIDADALERACVCTSAVGPDNRSEWSDGTWLTWLHSRLIEMGVFAIHPENKDDDLGATWENVVLVRGTPPAVRRRGRSLNTVDADPDAYRLSSDPDR